MVWTTQRFGQLNSLVNSTVQTTQRLRQLHGSDNTGVRKTQRLRQLHGSENSGTTQRFGQPWFKRLNGSDVWLNSLENSTVWTFKRFIQSTIPTTRWFGQLNSLSVHSTIRQALFWHTNVTNPCLTFDVWHSNNVKQEHAKQNNYWFDIIDLSRWVTSRWGTRWVTRVAALRRRAASRIHIFVVRTR